MKSYQINDSASIDLDAVNPETTPDSTGFGEQTITKLARIPNVALGKVLDGGKDAAHAAKLLAIKASKGDGYVLNEKCCWLHYGVSRRAFQSGIRRAKSVGTLVRERRGRSFAKEQPIDAGAGWYVQFDERLLTQRSALVGFVLAVNLARDPVLPSEAAKRIGVTAKGTIRKLVSDAEGLGAIEVLARSGRSSWVARRGYNFDLVKNEPVKNEPVKNDPTHRGMEEPHSSMKGRTQKTENQLEHATLSQAKSDARDSDFDSDGTRDSTKPEWIILKRWDNCEGIKSRGWRFFKGSVETVISLEDWRWWVRKFAPNAPGHLLTPDCYRQALEIAHELEAHENADSFPVIDAMEAIAVHVAYAVNKGRKIRSLGFIADRLLRELDNDDSTSIENRQTYLRDETFEYVHDLAHKWCDGLAQCDWFPHDRTRLVSTGQIETLSRLFDEYSEGAVLDGINAALAARHKPDEGRFVWGWTWFEQDIPKNSRRKRAA